MVFSEFIWKRLNDVSMRNKQKQHAIHRSIEILQDSVTLVNDSYNLSVVANRYNDVLEQLTFLSKLKERDLSDVGITQHPDFKQKLDEIVKNKDIIFNQAIERAFYHEQSKAKSLKTENGRKTRMNRFYTDAMNCGCLSSANHEHLNELYK